MTDSEILTALGKIEEWIISIRQDIEDRNRPGPAPVAVTADDNQPVVWD